MPETAIHKLELNFFLTLPATALHPLLQTVHC